MQEVTDIINPIAPAVNEKEGQRIQSEEGKEGLNQMERFLAPQETAYPRALEEVRNGKKSTHWMWYIFPQLHGLGQSTMASYYGIKDRDEAKAYLAHPVLGQRLREITRELLKQPETNPVKIFGFLDNLKLCSCMTLFWLVSGEQIFMDVLDQFFDGNLDPVTKNKLSAE